MNNTLISSREKKKKKMISYEKRKKRKVNNVRSRDVFVRFSREFLKGKKLNIIQYSIKLVKKVMFFI